MEAAVRGTESTSSLAEGQAVGKWRSMGRAAAEVTVPVKEVSRAELGLVGNLNFAKLSTQKMTEAVAEDRN